MLRAVSASAAAGRRSLSAWSPAVQGLVGSICVGDEGSSAVVTNSSSCAGSPHTPSSGVGRVGRRGGGANCYMLIGPSQVTAVRRLYSTSARCHDEKKDGETPDPTKEVKQSSNGISNPETGLYSINSDLTEDEINALLDAELAAMEAEAKAREYADWKPGQRKRPLQMSYRLEDFEAEFSGEATWTLRDKRCGALGIKLGMMPVWDSWGERHPCTVLHLDTNIVLRNKTADSPDGYDAVVLGAGERKTKNVNRALMATFEQFGVGQRPPYIVREFRVTTKDAMPEPGTQIHAGHFVAGQNVDISGISKGKGFQVS